MNVPLKQLKQDKRNAKRRKKALELKQYVQVYKDRIVMLETELAKVKLQRQFWIDKFSGLE